MAAKRGRGAENTGSSRRAVVRGAKRVSRLQEYGPAPFRTCMNNREIRCFVLRQLYDCNFKLNRSIPASDIELSNVTANEEREPAISSLGLKSIVRIAQK